MLVLCFLITSVMLLLFCTFHDGRTESTKGKRDDYLIAVPMEIVF